MRAMVVLPVPRGPQNRYACAMRFWVMALASVCVTCSWPTTSTNRCGRYFLAMTWYDIYDLQFTIYEAIAIEKVMSGRQGLPMNGSRGLTILSTPASPTGRGRIVVRWFENDNPHSTHRCIYLLGA